MHSLPVTLPGSWLSFQAGTVRPDNDGMGIGSQKTATVNCVLCLAFSVSTQQTAVTATPPPTHTLQVLVCTQAFLDTPSAGHLSYDGYYQFQIRAPGQAAITGSIVLRLLAPVLVLPSGHRTQTGGITRDTM
jgi:hypothetical protein